MDLKRPSLQEVLTFETLWGPCGHSCTPDHSAASVSPQFLLSVDLRLFCSSLSCFLLQDVGKQGWESGPAFLGHSLDCRASCLGAC